MQTLPVRLLSVPAGAFVLAVTACGDSTGTADDAGSPGGDTGTSTDGATSDGAPADGSVPTALPPYQSGSRLRAALLNGSDEGGVFNGWYDSLRDEDCEMVNTVDGIRCLPGTERTVRFLDAACTEAVVFPSECTRFDGPPEFLGRVALLSCGELQFESYRETSGRGTTMDYFVRNNDGECAPADSPPTAPMPYVQVERVDNTEFVNAEQVEIEQNDFLSVRYYRAMDGAVQAVELVDRLTGFACTPAAPADGVMSCIPQIPAWVIDLGLNGYVSDDCSSLLAYTTGCEPSVPTHAQLLAPRPCEQNGPGLVELGASVPAAQVMDGAVGMCSGATSAPATYSFYEVERQVPASELGAVQMLRRGSGRVQSQWWSIDGVTPLIGDRLNFYDTVRGTGCRLGTEFDGSPRCVPDTMRDLGGNTFADAACTQPLDTRFNASTACPMDPPSEILISRIAANGCVTGFELFETGDLVVPSTVYFGSPDDCVQASEIPPDSAYRTVGARLEFDVYPELEVARQ